MTSDFRIERHIFYSPKFRSVVEEAISFFMTTPVSNLPPAQQFGGVGVYALYYIGGAKFYAPISEANSDALLLPIYVGKAVPTGWRKGRARLSQGPELHRRLSEHFRSVEAASGIEPKDFKARFMILKGAEVDLVVPIEAELIRRYVPVWNTVIDGFGNHDPGSGRYDQAPSEWDILHPGRTWAMRLKGTAPSLEAVRTKLRGHLSSPGFPHVDDRFI